MIEDPVVTIKRAEERDFQFGVAAVGDDLRTAFDSLSGAVRAVFAAGVDGHDHSIVPKRILSGYALAIGFERVLVAGELEPVAEISVQLDSFSRLRN